MRIKEFTKNSPKCPKCGHRTKRRFHDHSKYGDFGTVLEGLRAGEYFIVICQDCNYSFPQHVQEAK